MLCVIRPLYVYVGYPRSLLKHRRVFRDQGAKERRYHRPRRGGVTAGGEAHLRGGELDAPPIPRQHVRMLPNRLARVLRDGVRGRWRPHDAHPRRRFLRAESSLLHSLRSSGTTVPPREQNHLQVKTTRSEASATAASDLVTLRLDEGFCCIFAAGLCLRGVL